MNTQDKKREVSAASEELKHEALRHNKVLDHEFCTWAMSDEQKIQHFVTMVMEDDSPVIENGEYHYEVSGIYTKDGVPFTSSISIELYNEICDE